MLSFFRENEKTFVETGVDPNCGKIYGLETDYNFVLKKKEGKIIPNWPRIHLQRKENSLYVPMESKWLHDRGDPQRYSFHIGPTQPF